MTDKPSLLFLCVANSARSQMAEGLARSLFGQEVNIESAGSRPSGKVHPMAIMAMKEIGIDIGNHFSKSYKSLDSTFLNKLDYLITLCDEEDCPLFLSKAQKLHWVFPDPAAENSIDPMIEFRTVRDRIKKNLIAFGRSTGFLR